MPRDRQAADADRPRARPLVGVGPGWAVTGLRRAPYAQSVSSERSSPDSNEGDLTGRGEHLIRSAPHAVIGIDADGVVTTWNPQAEATFGWSAQEAIGLALATLIIPPRMRSGHLRGMRRLAEGGVPRMLDTRIEMPARHRDGRSLMLDLSIIDTVTAGRREFLAFVRDVTVARAEGARVTSIARLPDESPSPILRVARSGQILYANPPARRLAPLGMVPQRWRPTIAASLAADQRTELVTVVSGRVLSFTVVPVSTAGYANLFGRDVTEQEAAESELRTSIVALRELYQITSDARMDLHEKVVRLLDLMAQRFGIGTGVLSRVVPEGFEILEVQAFNGLLQRGTVTPLDHSITAEVVRTGETLAVPRISASKFRNHYARRVFGLGAIVAVPVVADGRLFGVLSFSSPTARRTAYRPSDIEFLRLIARWIGGEVEREAIASDLALANAELLHTARRAAELAETAASASRAKSEFLAAMSHELRTPLHGIIGTLDLLVGRELDDAAHALVGILARSADRLLDTVNEVLDFSRVEAGVVELERSQVDVGALLRDVAELHDANARERGLQLDLTIAPDVPARMPLDPGRVTQVVGNLVSNAVKFTDAGRVDVRAEMQGQRLCVTVEDTGIGMDDQTLASLFRPFFQADGSTARRYGGTGLGLAIASGLVTAMHGELRAESTPGEGTRMTLLLPPLPASRDDRGRSAPDQPVAGALHVIRPPQPRSAVPGRPLVLVVDDDPVGVQIAATMLESLDCRIEVRMDAEAALERLTGPDGTEVPDLVLLDLHLPGRDGWSVAAALRQMAGPLHDVPIVAVSADAFENARRRCADAGMDGHLAKPFRRRDLQRLLHTWLPREDPAGLARVPFAVPIAVIASPSALAADLPDVLREALIAGGPARALEFLELFLESSANAGGVILAALGDGRVEDAAEMAHRLRGSSHAFGFDGLVVAARAIEDTAGTRRSSVHLARLADRLRDELDAATDRLAGLRPALMEVVTP